jgi:ectoine hydroxylase-related dioxygenase (phytanoyl-CoA dioxygenase family)
MTWSNEVEANGFAIQSNLFAPDWISQTLGAELQRSPRRTRAGIRHAMRFGAVQALARYGPLQQLACEVLGAQAFPFRATWFDKSSGANWLVVWHQDTALPLRERIEMPGWGPWSIKEGISYAHAPADVLSQILALRIHLDDSVAENGPLRVLPSSHTLGLLTDERIHELTEEIAAVDCLVPKGGVMGMRPLLVHSSLKARSEIPRRVLHIEYAASDSIASPLQLAIA